MESPLRDYITYIEQVEWLICQVFGLWNASIGLVYIKKLWNIECVLPEHGTNQESFTIG